MIDPEILREFIAEARDLVEEAEPRLIALETAKGGGGRDAGGNLAAVFRLFHSVKGVAGTLGLTTIAGLAHEAENLLSAMREGACSQGRAIVALLLEATDLLRSMLTALQAGQGEDVHASSAASLVGRIRQMAEAGILPTSGAPLPGAGLSDPSTATAGGLWSEELVLGAAEDSLLRSQTALRKHPVDSAEGRFPQENAPSSRCEIEPASPHALGESDSGSEFPDDAKGGAVSRTPGLSLPAKEAGPPLGVPGGIAIRPPRQDIRVDLRKLDALLDLVGELAIADAMLTRHPAVAALAEDGVERAIHQLQRVSRELQNVAMAVRMVPLGPTFQRMIRLVHDLAPRLGKQVELRIQGEETEVDKTVIEWILDPLVHLVRNALDHGIESPDERLAAGKAPTASLLIEGRHEGGEVRVTIADDGRGLDRKRIATRARARGLIAGDGSELDDARIWDLIFEPGFSTADSVTETSGRGVGMDVVRRNVERLKGRIEIQTASGRGTSFHLRIPATLAIIQGMLLRAGSCRCILPMRSIRESIRPSPGAFLSGPDGRELLHMRGEFMPVLRLAELFGGRHRGRSTEDGIGVLVEERGRRACLFVDELLGQQETVVKPLSPLLARVRGISGCTILGDGDVALIVDPAALLARGAAESHRSSTSITGAVR